MRDTVESQLLICSEAQTNPQEVFQRCITGICKKTMVPCFHSQIPRGRHPTQPLELKLRGIKEFKRRRLVFFVGSLWNISLKVVFEYSSVLIKIYILLFYYCTFILLKKLSHTDLTKFVF